MTRLKPKQLPLIYCHVDHKRPDGQATMLVAKHYTLDRTHARDGGPAADVGERWLASSYCVFCGPRGPYR